MPDTTPIVPAAPILSATVLSALFSKIDRGFTAAKLSDLFRVSGADEAQASLSLFNTLRCIILSDTSDIPTTGDDAPVKLQAGLDRLTAALDTGAFTGGVVSLVGMSGQQVASLAASHIGVRYSIANFVPFAIIGATDVYARHNLDGSMTRFDPATGVSLISTEYLGDRSQLFAARLASGNASQIAITGNQSFLIDDRSRRNPDGSSTRTQLTADSPNRPVGRVTFGADNTDGEIVAGGTGNDRLYGGGGDDNIRGGAGDDYIEGGLGNDYIQGGIGNDTLVGGLGDDEIEGGLGNDVVQAGEGDDVITGGMGDDRMDGGNGFDTYVINANDGNDVIMDSDGLGEVIYAGASLRGSTTASGGKYVSADGKITYSFAGDIDEGGVLTITTEGGRIKIRDFRNGMLGITLGDGSPGALFAPADPPVELPDGANRDSLRNRYTDFYPQIPFSDTNSNGLVAPPNDMNLKRQNEGQIVNQNIDDFITSVDAALPLVTGATFAFATQAWQDASNANVTDANSTLNPAIEPVIGVTYADVTSAMIDFHNDTADAQLGGDSLPAQSTNDSVTLTSSLESHNKLRTQTASLDTTHIAPRIGG
jgi:hypothetical protein